MTSTGEKVLISVSGLFLFIAGFIIFMGIITGEIFYTLDFNTRDNYISELAATMVPNTPVPELSETIFNSSMIVSGSLILIAAVLLCLTFRRLLVTIPLGIFGIGLIGVGVFPGDVVPWHGVFALLLFIFGGVGAITSFRIVSSPLKYVFIFLGILSLVFLIAYKSFIPALGVGGAERWVFYPEVFWITGLGGFLLGLKDQRKYS